VSVLPETPRRRLRRVLAAGDCVTMASVFDPMSARIAHDLGYEAALMGGSVVSHAILAAPDLILLTMTELAEQVDRCTRVSAVPIVVDGDHGFGNALNVMRTVRSMERAGAGAIMVEDTELPRPYGTADAPRLLSFEESVGKIRAAVEARGDSDLVVLGRTSAATVSGIDDAIARFRAFEDAGVDALFIPGVRSRSQLDKLASTTSLPLVLGGAAGDVADPAYLATRRVRLWSGGHQPFAVAVNALYEAMRAVRSGTPPPELAGIAPSELMNRLLDGDRYRALTRAHLGGE
jgi:oxaloacetate decarboxylase